VALVVSAGARTGAAAGRWRARTAALTAFVAVLLIGPGLWSAQALRTPASGTFPTARPGGSGGDPFGVGGGFGGVGSPQLVSFLRSHLHGETWAVAMTTSSQAAPLIIAGVPAMSMGGFNGNDRAMTPATLAGYVSAGALRFVFVGGNGVRGNTDEATAAVATACTEVPRSDWSEGIGIAAVFGGGFGSLYDCQGKGAALGA
jgi:hypothetical protein